MRRFQPLTVDRMLGRLLAVIVCWLWLTLLAVWFCQ